VQDIRTHPRNKRLTAFGLGRLSDADSQDIELHLASCEACRQQLADVPDDALIRLLQGSASDGPASASETHAGLSRLSADTDAATRSGESASPSDMNVAPPTFTLPRELEGHARYHVMGSLGAGGMGTVYKARHRLMERVVALKIVNPHLVNQPGAVERFTREVKAAAHLVHPNIVTAYDAEKLGDLNLLVMEFVDGQTLAQVLAVEHELPIATACDYIRQTALGLQHALDRGMVHRDIKPQNLMLVSREAISGSRPSTLDSRPVVKILDFGLARFVSEQAPSDGTTAQGTLMGSVDYMAPEQGRDAHDADARADIYGMGCTLYHLLAAQIPFPATSLLEKLEAHRDQQPKPLCRVRPAVPIELSQVVAKMMAKDPTQRYQTPAEVALALQPFTRAEPTPLLALAPRLSRARHFAVATGAVLLIALIGYWAAQIVFRVETPHGTLIVTTDDPDVQISVKSGGTEVALFFPKQKKEIPLKVGKYTIELVKGKKGLKLSTNKFEITSGQDQRTVTVEFEPAVVASKDPPKAEEQTKASDVEKAFAWPGDDLWLGRVAAPDLSQAKELYRDDFASLDTTWPIAKTAVGEYGREQSTYFISANPYQVQAAWLKDQTYSNFACQVVGRVAKATSTQWYLNYTSAKNQVTVRFHLNGGQALQISILNDGPTRLVQTIWHSALKQGEEFNKLLVVARGNRFELYANDVAICNPMVLDVITPPGHFALGAVANDNPVRAEFKSFTIWSAEGLPTPEERLAKGDLKGPLVDGLPSKKPNDPPDKPGGI
jgi:serine/threonine protein kinase